MNRKILLVSAGMDRFGVDITECKNSKELYYPFIEKCSINQMRNLFAEDIRVSKFLSFVDESYPKALLEFFILEEETIPHVEDDFEDNEPEFKTFH